MKMQDFMNLQPSPKTKSNTRPHGLGWRLTWFVIWTCSGAGGSWWSRQVRAISRHLSNFYYEGVNNYDTKWFNYPISWRENYQLNGAQSAQASQSGEPRVENVVGSKIFVMSAMGDFDGFFGV